MTCTQCGRTLAKDQFYCRSCGHINVPPNTVEQHWVDSAGAAQLELDTSQPAWVLVLASLAAGWVLSFTFSSDVDFLRRLAGINLVDVGGIVFFKWLVFTALLVSMPFLIPALQKLRKPRALLLISMLLMFVGIFAGQMADLDLFLLSSIFFFLAAPLVLAFLGRGYAGPLSKYIVVGTLAGGFSMLVSAFLFTRLFLSMGLGMTAAVQGFLGLGLVGLLLVAGPRPQPADLPVGRLQAAMGSLLLLCLMLITLFVIL